MMLLISCYFALRRCRVPEISPSFVPRQAFDGVRQLADIDVRVARHHSERLPAAEPLQREQIAVFGVVPRRPSVATVMRREIL